MFSERRAHEYGRGEVQCCEMLQGAFQWLMLLGFEAWPKLTDNLRRGRAGESACRCEIVAMRNGVQEGTCEHVTGTVAVDCSH